MVEIQNGYVQENSPTLDYASELYDTKKSLESLKEEIGGLTESEKESIQKLPDYKAQATSEEKLAREKYFIQLKNNLTTEIDKQAKDEKGQTKLTKALSAFEGESDFERLISYLHGKEKNKKNAIACSAIDLGIWTNLGSEASSYLIKKRDDYFHILETITHPIKEANKKEQRKQTIDAYESIPIEEPQIIPIKNISSPDQKQERSLIENKQNGFAIDSTKSLGVEKSPSGVTLCSRTAWRNLTETLGVTPQPPREGSALATMLSLEYQHYSPLVGSIFTDHYKDSWGKNMPDNCKDALCNDNKSILDQLEDGNFTSNANCGEIYLSSRGHPQYGHRAAICKGTDGNRYVLDPYVGGAGSSPQLLKSYINKCTTGTKAREIYRINLFQSQT